MLGTVFKLYYEMGLHLGGKINCVLLSCSWPYKFVAHFLLYFMEFYNPGT